MNIQDLKNICITDLLSRYGHTPKIVKRNNFWYLSPLRAERTPSFKVDIDKNLWYDFGLAKGGNIVSLAMLLTKAENISEVLCKMSVLPLKVSYRPQPISRNYTNPFTNIVTKELCHKSLFQYLTSRCISPELAKRYCKEVHYTTNSKNYFAIGFSNRSGGYELRNAFFKGCIAPKDITIIKHDNDVCHVFEGFVDFLSFVMLHDECDAVVLNSVVNLPKAIDVLSLYNRVVCHLDNDDSGKSATRKLISILNKTVVDASQEYSSFKDLNDYLQNNKNNSSIWGASLCFAGTQNLGSPTNLALREHNNKLYE